MKAHATGGAGGGGRGMALIAVLWMVAALSVLVAGVVQAQRGELRMASAARDTLQGEAAGQAAIYSALQRITAGGPGVTGLARMALPQGGLDIPVEVMPLTGLVDLNLAPAPLVEALLGTVGGTPAEPARAIAEALVLRRQAGAEAGGMLASPEELLALPGVDYDLFARITGFVSTDSRGSGRINPLAAPLEVLQFLARGDQALAERIAADRDAGAVAIDTTRLEGAFIDASVSSRFRFTAYVPLANGVVVRVIRDIDTQPAPDSAAPWRTLRAATRWSAVVPAGR